MALTNFTIVKYQDKYRINNVGVVNINVSVTLLNADCTAYDLVESYVIVPGQTTTLSTPFDGMYKIDMIDTNSEESIITIPHYFNLLNSIIDDIQFILCDCAEESNCTDCTHTAECNRQLSNILKINSYISLTYPLHSAFLQSVFEEIRCSVRELTTTLVAEETIDGVADHVPLLKKILSYYYLAFYHSEYKNASLEERDYVITKFQYTQISTCIEDIIVTNVQTKIDSMATYTVISGAYINQPPTIGDFTIERPNRVVTPATLDQFTALTTPPYDDPEGDPIDAMRIDSIPGTNLGVYQYDNVDITVGLIIPADHIIAGRLVHIGADTDAAVNDSFGFSLRDTGSMTWVS